MIYHVVKEGQRTLMVRPDGKMDLIIGPTVVFAWRRRFQVLTSHAAHPGEYLVVRSLDGQQEHLLGPVRVWLDPRTHSSVEKKNALQLLTKEAVVVYSRSDHEDVSRRIVYGPAAFVRQPGEWLHTFSWHGAEGGSRGQPKVAGGLRFQKLRLMPDQMYHDVPEVRTSDDAVLTIRLMIFFTLVDIERMLDTTRDPIGDFVNATTSDVVEFVGRHTFESFKRSTEGLNDLAAYEQLDNRAQQCGFQITKVVYRGYGATQSLQHMHEKAIESRTGLQLEKVTEEQAQDLEDFKLEREMRRSTKRRDEQEKEVEQEIRLRQRRAQVELELGELRRAFRRTQAQLDSDQEDEISRRRDALKTEFLTSLKKLDVDITEYLTQGRSDRIIELRGSNSMGTHVHLRDSALEVEDASTTD